ncbi:hypothetical protein MIC97_16560 [Aquamicrobium sp. NLF2-7]|uniref:hypothetical protein n=1 Tax=Aquamicrobium sp. NLF2-7 TaxID=2918753 RepID=UPI001EFBAD8E|nr:hypothetical protein [Aquamicrobium sp. NLF2-7]MCG8273112.1 hypothetical protein [Aquamicrobium sp. NLF2-7]
MSAVFPLEDDPRWREHVATSGQTVFPVPYPFQDNSDICIQKLGLDGSTTDLSEPEHYALTGAGNPAGGSYALTTPAVAGEKYRSIGDAVGNRVQSVVRAGRYSSAATDNDLDRALIRDLELKRDLSRTFKADYGEQPGRVALLPAGHFHKADEHGNLIDGGSAEDVAAAQENAAAAKEDAERAEAARDVAEEMAGSVQWPVSYGVGQTLLAVQRLQAQANIGPVKFDTVAGLLADTILAYSLAAGLVAVAADKIVEAQGFRYEVAASGATDHHIETAGGVKLYVLPLGDRMHAAAFGLRGDGDETGQLQKLFSAGAGYEIRLGRAQRYLTTEELALADDTSLNLRGSCLDFACIGAKRNLAVVGNNVSVYGGVIRNVIGTPGLQSTYQTPIVIARYDYLDACRNVTIEHMHVETVAAGRPGIAVFGDTENVIIRNIVFPDSAYLATPITVHWSFNGDWSDHPPKTTVHQRNIVIENISIGRMTYNSGIEPDMNICGVYLSAVYNAKISNVTIEDMPHGKAVTVYAGDWGFQHSASEVERRFGSCGIEIDNIRGYVHTGLEVYMLNPLDPPSVTWPTSVVVSNMHVKGRPENVASQGLRLGYAPHVSIKNSSFDGFNVGASISSDVFDLDIDDVDFINCARWGVSTSPAALTGRDWRFTNCRFKANNQSSAGSVADILLQNVVGVLLEGNKFDSPLCAFNIRALNTAARLRVRNNHSDGAATICYSFGAGSDFGIVEEYVNNTSSVTPSAGVRGGQTTLPIMSFTRSGAVNQRNTVYTSPIIPTVGVYAVGDRVLLEGATAGQACEAICTVAGSPGTWLVTKQSGPLGGNSAAPNFVGQIAIFGGNAYVATGVASAADWKVMT